MVQEGGHGGCSRFVSRMNFFAYLVELKTGERLRGLGVGGCASGEGVLRGRREGWMRTRFATRGRAPLELE